MRNHCRGRPGLGRTRQTESAARSDHGCCILSCRSTRCWKPCWTTPSRSPMPTAACCWKRMHRERLRQRLARRRGAKSLAADEFLSQPDGRAVGAQTAIRRDHRRHASGRQTAPRARRASSRSGCARWSRFRSTPCLAPTRRNPWFACSAGSFWEFCIWIRARPAAFSKLDRQILDAIAIEGASILDNARLVERERERQRIEQELGIARDIQQALLPRGFRDFPHLAVSGDELIRAWRSAATTSMCSRSMRRAPPF